MDKRLHTFWLKLEITCSVLDGLLEIELSLPGDIEGGEQVGYEAEEDGIVVRHDLGQVEVPQSPHQDLFLRPLQVSSLTNLPFLILGTLELSMSSILDIKVCF